MVTVRDQGVIAFGRSLESMYSVPQDPEYVKWRRHPSGGEVLEFVERNVASMTGHIIGCVVDVQEFSSWRSALRIVHRRRYIDSALMYNE